MHALESGICVILIIHNQCGGAHRKQACWLVVRVCLVIDYSADGCGGQGNTRGTRWWMFVGTECLWEVANWWTSFSHQRSRQVNQNVRCVMCEEDDRSTHKTNARNIINRYIAPDRFYSNVSVVAVVKVIRVKFGKVLRANKTFHSHGRVSRRLDNEGESFSLQLFSLRRESRASPAASLLFIKARDRMKG